MILATHPCRNFRIIRIIRNVRIIRNHPNHPNLRIGGIKEHRTTAARLGYRTDQRERIATLERENEALRAEV